jgi:F0F1-type ATP synthase beta subunit
MNVIGEPIDERGPILTKKKLPIHRDAPSFQEQGGGSEVLITGIFSLPFFFFTPTISSFSL